MSFCSRSELFLPILTLRQLFLKQPNNQTGNNKECIKKYKDNNDNIDNKKLILSSLKIENRERFLWKNFAK